LAFGVAPTPNGRIRLKCGTFPALARVRADSGIAASTTALWARIVSGSLIVASSLLANGRAIVKAPNVLKMVPVVAIPPADLLLV
jgi:hypothetical protein